MDWPDLKNFIEPQVTRSVCDVGVVQSNDSVDTLVSSRVEEGLKTRTSRYHSDLTASIDQHQINLCLIRQSLDQEAQSADIGGCGIHAIGELGHLAAPAAVGGKDLHLFH